LISTHQFVVGKRDVTSIQALIFDMDGLLVDSETLAANAVVDFVSLHGHTLTDAVGAKLLGRRLPDAVAILKEEYQLPDEIETLLVSYDDLRLNALRGNLKPMPGAAEAVAFAREAGLKLALATSGSRHHVDLSLGETGLTGLFDAEVTGMEVEHGKPAPDLFLRAAELLGVDPANCVVLEDSPPGIAAASAAGMRSIAIPNAHSSAMTFPVAPTVTLPSLFDAIDWLRSQGI
jgi:HAD superfamily hydrolase (TIGR01509 family)